MVKNQAHVRKHGGSIENTSILRKFTILFLLMSIIPIIVLYYFYTQIRAHGSITMTESQYALTLAFVVAGVLVGFLSMRSVLQKLIKLTEANRKALENVLSPEKVKELSQEENEIAVLAQSFTEITTRLEDNVRSLELTKRTLHSVMAKVGHGISNMDNIDTFLELILETVTDALGCTTGVLMLCNKEKTQVKIKAVYGVDFSEIEHSLIDVVPGTTIGDVIASKNFAVVDEVPRNIVEPKKHDALFKSPLICAPMIYKDKVNGVIAVSGSQDRKETFDEDEVNLLKSLAMQTAVAVENAKLNKDIESTYFETISALALAVDAKDRYSRGHLDRVADYCVQIGKRIGLDDQDLKTLRDAARLHDLGKIGIPDEVLKKEGDLNEQERLLMEKHAEIGESIVKPIRSLNHLCDIIRHHHEKLNGLGYPDGLKGDEIAPLVRITTVADIYDALTTDRPYRPKFSQRKACQMLKEMKDELDQDIVDVFIETLEERS